MTIEKKLERVMEIGVGLGNAKYSCLAWADQETYVLHENLGLKQERIAERNYKQIVDQSITLWIEFNKIVEDIKESTFERWMEPIKTIDYVPLQVADDMLIKC